jgi:hypothetical protein
LRGPDLPAAADAFAGTLLRVNWGAVGRPASAIVLERRRSVAVKALGRVQRGSTATERGRYSDEIMETSVEKLTALFFLITGLSHIFQPRVWVQFFIFLREKGEVGSFLNAFVHFPLGAFIVASHNLWHGIPMIVTIIGWGLLVKGAIYFIAPRFGLRMLATVSLERSWQFVVAGIFSVALAGVISYPLM